MVRIILVIFFVLTLCEVVSDDLSVLQAQSPLADREDFQFIRENIDFEINNKKFSVNGVYCFFNSSDIERVQTILFPFSDKSDSLTVKRVYNLTYSERLDYRTFDNAILFNVFVLPGDTVNINIAYSQNTMKENVYILKSTHMWGKALKQADYSLTFDHSVQIDSMSIKPDLLINNVYFCTKRDFLPSDDFKVWIK